MKYFIEARSFAAPFCSDSSTAWVEANSATDALLTFAREFSHPAGLYAAECYTDANALHGGEKPLAEWRSNLVIAKEHATKGKSCYSYRGISATEFEIDGVRFTVENPRQGMVTKARASHVG